MIHSTFSVFTDFEQMLIADITKQIVPPNIWACSSRERIQFKTSQETVGKDTKKHS